MTEEMRGVPARRSSGGWAVTLVIIVFTLVIIILAAGAYLVFVKGWAKGQTISDPSKYQAVFLTNGQAYFGKISGENKQYVSISDAYYLVLNQPLQNQNKDSQSQDQSKPEYTLVKLGKEMHGPTSMSINRDQILFIENLSDDSKVVSAIRGGNK